MYIKQMNCAFDKEEIAKYVPMQYINLFSLGILLWELWSSGKTPYSGISNSLVLDKVNAFSYFYSLQFSPCQTLLPFYTLIYLYPASFLFLPFFLPRL